MIRVHLHLYQYLIFIGRKVYMCCVDFNIVLELNYLYYNIGTCRLLRSRGFHLYLLPGPDMFILSLLGLGYSAHHRS